MDQPCLIDAEKTKPVVDVWWEPRALRDEVEHAELACDPGILELKIGIEIDHPVVPVQLALVHGNGKRGSKKCLGGGSDLKDCLGVDGLAAFAPRAEAFGVDKLVIGDNADGQPRHIERLHPVPDISLEIGDQRLDAILHAL
jgi:hypothetical protein